MASKRHRHMPNKSTDRPRKDRIVIARKAQLEMEQVKEAEMEARVPETARRVTVVCSNCKQRNQFDVQNGVPLAPCPNCGSPLGLSSPGRPQVVSR